MSGKQLHRAWSLCMGGMYACAISAVALSDRASWRVLAPLCFGTVLFMAGAAYFSNRFIKLADPQREAK